MSNVTNLKNNFHMCRERISTEIFVPIEVSVKTSKPFWRYLTSFKRVEQWNWSYLIVRIIPWYK